MVLTKAASASGTTASMEHDHCTIFLGKRSTFGPSFNLERGPRGDACLNLCAAKASMTSSWLHPFHVALIYLSLLDPERNELLLSNSRPT